MADEIVGPVPVSTHDSQLDQTRPDDFAALTANVPGAARATRTIGASLTPAEKAALRNAAAAEVFVAQERGAPEAEAVAAGVNAKLAAGENLSEEVKALMASSPEPTDAIGRFDQLSATQTRQEMEAAVAATTDFSDMVQAGFSELTALPGLVRMMQDPDDNEVDPNFDYMAIRDRAEAPWTAEEDKQYLREARNARELERRTLRLQERQDNYKTLGAHGPTLAVAAGLVGGVADPVGWAAGFGVGKVAQLGAAGVRAARIGTGLAEARLAVPAVGDAWVAGAADEGWSAAQAFSNGVTETVKYGAYGAAGNLLTDATYDAAGGHVTFNDYVASAAFGAAFGQLGRLGSGRPDAEVKAAADVLEEQAADLNTMLYAKAQQRAGADATADDIRREVDNIVGEEVLNTRAVLLADVEDGNKILPTGAEPTNMELESILLPVADRQAALDRAGITPELVADDGERLLMGELFARAEKWEAANPIDERRVSILAKVPWLRSTGLGLATSQHPVAKWISGTLLENSSGVAGRRRTAAMTKAMQERIYLSDLAEFNKQYEAWRNKNGGGAISELFGSEHSSRFGKMVYREVEARRVGGQTTNNPEVKAAADSLERGFNRMRLDAQKAGVPGADRFKDTSVGYMPRRISQQWVLSSTPGQRAAVSQALARQLAEGDGWDLPFAQRIAAQYIERGRTEAYGGETLPANLHSPEAAGMLADIMRKENIPAEDIARLLGRFSRGGSSYTKKRLDLDLTEDVSLPDGQVFSLMDAFDTDVGKLYHRYARRMSGEVALSRFGVPGEQGLKMLRKALEYGGPDGKGVGDDNMKHFDQIAAEFLGRPLQLPGMMTGNKYLGNLRLLTAASRLGGMVFTQFAETANAVGVLGVKGAMSSVKAIPRMISEIRTGKANPILDSMEVISAPIGKDHEVVIPFQEPSDVKVYGQDSLNAFDRIVRAGANAVPWLSGWHYMHGAQQRGMTEQITMKAMRYIRDGKEDVALEQMGINASLAERLRGELDTIAKFDERGTLSALDLTKARDAGAVADFVQAVTRGAGQIIQKTYIGETGKWAHDDLLRLLVQFRSFSLVSMEKQWTRQRVDFGTAQAFGLLMGSMAFALPIHLARVQINSIGREDREEYIDRQTSPMALARATLNYTSLAGLSGDILDSGAALGGYEMSGVRTGQTDALGQIPALGYVNDVFQAAVEKSPNDAVRLLPGGNLPWLMPVVNATKDDGQ